MILGGSYKQCSEQNNAQPLCFSFAALLEIRNVGIFSVAVNCTCTARIISKNQLFDRISQPRILNCFKLTFLVLAVTVLLVGGGGGGGGC